MMRKSSFRRQLQLQKPQIQRHPGLNYIKSDENANDVKAAGNCGLCKNVEGTEDKEGNLNLMYLMYSVTTILSNYLQYYYPL